VSGALAFDGVVDVAGEERDGDGSDAAGGVGGEGEGEADVEGPEGGGAGAAEGDGEILLLKGVEVKKRSPWKEVLMPLEPMTSPREEMSPSNLGAPRPEAKS
jgi:hypothetical protein